MKLRLILIISVCVNLALAGVYVMARRSSRPTLTPTADSAEPAAKPGKPDRERRAIHTVVVDGTNTFRWASVESDDYREYIANLRAIGCPEETIRDIIIADINKLYAGRIAALYPSPKDFKYWQTDNREQRNQQRELGRKRRELENEKRELVKQLLGIDLEAEMAKWEGRPDDDAWRLGWLSPEKQQAVEALQEKFRDLERAAFTEMRENRGSPEARAKFAALRAQREAELAQVLGADYQEYQLRNSATARSMRDNLSAFSPSEEEFRKIFDLRNTFDTQFGFGFGREGTDETVREQRRVAQQQLDEQLRATLGEQRYQEYVMSQDGRFNDAYDFATRANLPNAKEVAQSIYDIRQTVEAQRQQVLNNSNIPQDQRAATLTQLADETRKTLQSTMTPEAYQQYVSSRDGRWVGNLASVDTGARGMGNDTRRFPGGGFGPAGGPGGGRGGDFFRRRGP